MRNSFTLIFRKYIFTGLAICIGMAAIAQRPNAVGTDLVNGTYIDTPTINLGLFNQFRFQATVSADSGTRKVEFPEYVGQFYNVWRSSDSGGVLSGFNAIIDPVTQPVSATWFAHYGGYGILLPAIDSGNYYTVNIMTNRGYASDTMAILETSYRPDSIISLSLPIDTNEVGPSCSPTIIVVLAAPPSTGEYVYLRYSLNGFEDSSSVILMTVSGDTATCQIPAYPAGTNVQYYVLTTPNILIPTGPASGYYDCQTLNLKTGSIGNNYRYTVKTLPVPSVSVTVSQNPVCGGGTDTFIAHAVNTGAVAPDYQWYKNGVAVGTDDSIYTDHTLVNGDSVRVVLTANLVCPVMDTTSYIIVMVNSLPTGTAIAVPAAVCLGDTSIAIATPAQAADSVTWYSSSINGIVLGTDDSLEVIPATPGTDSVFAQYTSPAGCTSAQRTQVAITVYPLAIFTQTDTFCNGDSIIVGTHSHNSTGTYIDTLQNASMNGCDSIVTTNLTVKQPVTYTQIDTVCYGHTFTVGSAIHSATGTYIDTLSNASANGCDSIVTTAFTVLAPDTFTQNVVFCQGDSIIVGSHTYSVPGTYTDTLVNAGTNGCDSIVTTNLTVNPLPTGTATANPAAVCLGDTSIAIATPTQASDSVAWYSSSVAGIVLGTDDSLDVVPATPGIDSVFAQFTSAAGCTNTQRTPVAITVYPIPVYTQNPAFCGSGSVTVGPNTYTTSGTYTDTLFNASSNGCDSIVYTNLTINPFGTFTQFDSVCPGGSFTENGHTYTTNGTYMDTFTNAAANGCDSIVTTNLYVRPTSTYTQYDTICQGSSFIVDGHPYTSNGTYMDAFTNASVNGCDSIVTTNLYVRPSATYTQYDTICQEDSFIENSHVYTMSNTYMDTFMNASIYGCDSIVTTNLYVRPTSAYTQYDTICQGSSFTENSHTYTANGTYMDTFTNASIYGCDSIVTTNLYVRPSTAYTQYDTICQGSSFTENSNTYTTGGTYMDTFANASVNGCDSVVTTNLYVRPYPTYTQNPSFCQGDSVVVGPNTYTAVGSYIDTLHGAAANGCDSIVYTNVTILPSSMYTQAAMICQGSSYTEGSHTYTAAGTYIDTLSNASVNGCDSIVTTNLTMVPAVNYTQNPTFCGSGSVAVGSNTYTTSGNYTDTLFNAALGGCDSVVHTNLTINPIATYIQYDSICPGSSFTENSNTYTTSGAFIDTFTNAAANGCDSIVITNLFVRPTSAYTQYDSICPGSSFTENGHTYTMAGTYIDTFSNASVTGCDSIVTTNLFVRPTSAYTQYDSICPGSSFTENGHTYTMAGTYIDTFSNASIYGCDSVVTTNLYVRPSSAYTQYDTICQGSSFTENSHTYTMSGTYMDTFTNASATGCDSIVTTFLTVNQPATSVQTDTVCYGQTFAVGSAIHSATGTFTDTLNNASANGCDSIVTTALTVLTPDTFTQNVTFCQGDSIIVGSHTYDSSGTYVDTLTGAGTHGCDSIVTTNLTVNPLATGTAIANPAVVCLGDSSIAIATPTQASDSVTWYSSSIAGTVLATGDSLEVIPAAPGTDSVFAQFTSQEGCTNTQRTPVAITVYPFATYTQTDTFCNSDSIIVGTHVHNTSGTFIDTLFNASMNGCDSIVTTNLVLRSPATSAQIDTVCNANTFAVGTNIHNATGIYTDTLHGAAANGCDSIVTTALTVLTPDTFTQNVTFCQGDSIIVGSHTYDSSGTYVDTLTGAGTHGCDSIVTTNLTVNPLATGTATANPAVVCLGDSSIAIATPTQASDSVTWYSSSVAGLVLATGDSLEVIPAAPGTDSVFAQFTSQAGCTNAQRAPVSVTAYPAVTYSQIDTFCSGDSIIVGTHIHYIAGTYIDTLQNGSLHGCDSVVTTMITIFNAASSSQIDTICSGQSVIVGPYTHDSSGTYIDTLHSASTHGCDSIVTTSLYVYPQAAYTQYDTICQGSSVTENGHTYTTSNTYIDTFHNGSVTGCDSIVTTNLYVNPTPTVNNIESQVVCNNTPTAAITFTGSVPGTVYNWTGSNSTIGLAPGGIDSIPSFIAINTDSIIVVDTIIVTPSYTNGGVTCTGTPDTFNITVQPSPVVNTPDQGVCNGDTTTSIIFTSTIVGSTYTWTGSNPTIGLATGGEGNIPSFTAIDTGITDIIDTIVVVGTSPQNCIGVPDTFHITVHHTPHINLGPNVNQCGGNVLADAGNPGSTFHWSDNTTHEIDTISTSGLYTVTVTTIFGCIDSAGKTVYIKSAPVVNLGPDRIICGDSTVLDAGYPGSHYTWTGGSTGEFLTVYTSGTYSVTVTDTASSCSGSDSVAIIISHAPVVDLGGDTSQCGGTITISATTANATYLWSNGDTTGQITVSTSGSYSVTITNANGCTGSGSKNVNIYPQPTLGPDVTDSICPGSTANLHNYYINSGLTLTYSTSDPSSVDSGKYIVTGTNSNGCTTSALITIKYRIGQPAIVLSTDTVFCGDSTVLTAGAPSGHYIWSNGDTTYQITIYTSGTYSVTATNGSGCSATGSELVTIYPQPNLGANVADSVCPGSTADLHNYYINSGLTLTYSTATPDSVGPGVYTVTGTNSNGCDTTATITITYRVAQPAITLSHDTVFCGDSTILIAGSRGSSYRWSTGDTTSQITVYTSGTYSVTATNGSGCTAAGSEHVTIYPQPVLGPDVTDSICPGSTADLYNYFINSGLTLTYNTATPASVSEGTYTVTGTNSNGCFTTATITIVSRARPMVTIAPLVAMCTGAAAIDLVSYFSPTGGTYSGPGVSGNFFYPNLAAPGLDSIFYYYTDNHGCGDTVFNTVTITPAVKVSLHTTQSNFTICKGQPITFTASGATFYQFFVNDSAQGPADTINFFTTTTLNNHDQVSVVGSNSCSSDTSDYMIIDVITPPTVSAGQDTTITLGQTVTLQGTASGVSALIYYWSPDSFLSATNIPNPVYSGPDTIRFELKVTDTYGCTDSAYVTVNVEIPDNIQLPNVITPNGDGKNDLWVLDPKIDLIGSHLVVFNRWGELVFETYNYANNWGGTYKGTNEKLPDDTYYYVLTVPAQNNHTYKGPINILGSSGK